MSNVTPFKRTAPPASVTEWKTLTIDEMCAWVMPPIQRIPKINAKVIEYSEELKASGGVIHSAITIGHLPNDPADYLVDGGHRREGAKLSGLQEFLAEIRSIEFANLTEMAQEFRRCNRSLVAIRPDDILRSLEHENPLMHRLHEQCSFIGYDNVRRASHNSCIVSMSAVLRGWFASEGETPAQHGSALKLADDLDEADVQHLSTFLNTAYSAWKEDPEYYRLWAAMNITMCMWMFRQLVLKDNRKTKVVQLNVEQFRNCLMTVSASEEYLRWLVGRSLSEVNRSPCYDRLRRIFARALSEERFSKKVMFPQPAWYSGGKK